MSTLELPERLGQWYIYRWNRQGRKGQRCFVVIRATKMNSCLICFEDGYCMVTSRNALRKAEQ